MEWWPSDRVAQGGIFQPAKASYSPETSNFLKVLTDESKLTMMQRKPINYSLRSGGPLPPIPTKSEILKSKEPKVLIRPGTSKRRSQNTIVNSGAYEREKFVPRQPRVDREQAKRHLQDFMAFGKDVRPTPRRVNLKKDSDKELPNDVNRFDQLIEEIRDREKWLEEMETLGEAHKYRLIIQQQIQAKLREIEKLKPAPPTLLTSRTSSKN